MNEYELTTNVIDLAMKTGWQVCHFRPARTEKGWVTAVQGHAGFPDICAAKEGRVVFIELKIGKGKLTEPQVQWGAALTNYSDPKCATEHYVMTEKEWPLGFIEIFKDDKQPSLFLLPQS